MPRHNIIKILKSNSKQTKKAAEKNDALPIGGENDFSSENKEVRSGPVLYNKVGPSSSKVGAEKA